MTLEIEYQSGENAPQQFHLQAVAIFRQGLDDSQYSIFTQKLAHTYIPGATRIPGYPNLMKNDFLNVTLAMERQLGWILSGVRENLKGKRILDLGCGSTGGTIEAEELGHYYEPWLCRALFELGAYPIGVDIGNLDKEKFQTHSIDLLLPNALNMIPNNSIDIVHSRALFGSLELIEQAEQPGRPFLSHEVENYLMEILRPQIGRILKPDGTFIYSIDP